MFTTLPVAFLSGYIQNAPAQASENSRSILITAREKKKASNSATVSIKEPIPRIVP